MAEQHERAAWTSTSQRRVTAHRARVGLLLAVVGLCLGVALVGCASSGSTSIARSGTATSHSADMPGMPDVKLTQLVRAAVGKNAQTVRVTYDTPSQAAQVMLTVSGAVPRTTTAIDQAHEHVKTLAFEAQRAVWTSSVAIQQSTVTILGPMLNDYAEPIVDAYGVSVLNASHAATITWTSAQPDATWPAYDRVWLRYNYAPNWHYSASPEATSTPAR